MRTRTLTSRPRREAVVVVALCGLLLGQLAGPLGAAADDVALVTFVPELGCETAPIDGDRYAAAMADPDDDVGLPDPVPYAVPVGEPADRDTAAEVQGIVRELAACVNEGRVASFLSLFSDAWLAGHIGDLGLGGRPDDRAPEPMAEGERLIVISVADVTLLPDGRVAALVLLTQEELTYPELTSVMTFAGEGGALRIDDWQPVTLSGDGGTPIPAPCGEGETADDPWCDTTPTPDVPPCGDVAPGCSPEPTSTPFADAWERVSGPGYTGVIAPLALAPVFREGHGTQASGWWLPTAEEIAALEAELPGYLAGLDDARANAVAEKLDGYVRQYAGLVVEGRALIYVNLVCQELTDEELTSGLYLVDDGGDCYLQLYWEPGTGEFSHLTINGDA